MSTLLMAAVWKIETLPLAQKMVLLSLADNVNSADLKLDPLNGVCWPSLATIARRSSMSERNVFRCLNELEILGHLRRVFSPGKAVRYYLTPILGLLPVDNSRSAPDAEPGGTSGENGLTTGNASENAPTDNMSVPTDNMSVPTDNMSLPPYNPPILMNQNRTLKVPKDFFVEPMFDEFYDLFPRQRRGNREKAWKAWINARKRASGEDILSGLRRYRQSTLVASGWAKGAAAWLNDDRWTEAYQMIAAAESPPASGPAERPQSELETAWQRVMTALEARIAPATFRSWLMGLRLAALGPTVSVRAPSRFVLSYVQNHFSSDILAAVQLVSPDVQKLVFIL